MILEDFEKLLELYLKGRLSASQKAEMEKMLDEFKAEGQPHDFTQQEIDAVWNRIDAETAPPKPLRPWSWIPIAAAIAVIAAGSLIAIFWSRAPSDKIILSDGTLVWLKPGATLDYKNTFSSDRREVALTGEALFEVSRDAEHPFVIHCGKYVASVLGTSFNIKALDSIVELTVLTGKVRVASATTNEAVVVGSREHVVFSESKGVVHRTNPKTEELKQVIANTQYDMHFEDTKMNEIVDRVEGKFDVNIELEDESIRNCMISADFTDQSLPVTLIMISEALGVEYEINGKSVTIRGTGCQE